MNQKRERKREKDRRKKGYTDLLPRQHLPILLVKLADTYHLLATERAQLQSALSRDLFSGGQTSILRGRGGVLAAPLSPLCKRRKRGGGNNGGGKVLATDLPVFATIFPDLATAGEIAAGRVSRDFSCARCRCFLLLDLRSGGGGWGIFDEAVVVFVGFCAALWHLLLGGAPVVVTRVKLYACFGRGRGEEVKRNLSRLG